MNTQTPLTPARASDASLAALFFPDQVAAEAEHRRQEPARVVAEKRQHDDATRQKLRESPGVVTRDSLAQALYGEGAAPSRPPSPAPAPAPAPSPSAPKAEQLRPGDTSRDAIARTFFGGERAPATKTEQPAPKPSDPPADAGKPAGDAAPAPFEFKPNAEGRTIDPGVATALSEVARELKIDNAAAQKIVDKMQPALAARMQSQIDQVVAGWEAETNAALGDRRDEAVRHVKMALAEFATPELRKLLGPTRSGGTGLGNHPAIVRFIAAIGRRLDEENGDLTR